MALSALVTAIAGAQADPRPVHVVGTFDGTALRLYVDGSLVGQKPVGETVQSASTPVEIGAFLGGSSWKGSIDEVALYDRPLSAETVRRHHVLGGDRAAGRYAEAVRSTSGLVAYWRLNEGSPTQAADALRRHPGRYPTAARVGSPSLIADKTGHAVALDGSRGGVVVTNARDLSLTRRFTLEAWASTDDHRAQTIVAKAGSWFLKTNAAGQWGVGVFTGSALVSVYSKESVPVTQPAAAGGGASTASQTGGDDSGSHSGLITLGVVVAIALGAGLVILTRRDDDDRPEGEAEGRDEGEAEGDAEGEAAAAEPEDAQQADQDDARPADQDDAEPADQNDAEPEDAQLAEPPETR
jgi:hypothetical protein